MNPYFVFFALYALVISPVRAHVSVRVGHGVRYRVLLQISGLPFLRKTDAGDPKRERPVRESDVAGALSGETVALIRAVCKSHALSRALRMLRFEGLHLHARLSFEDAALTALCYTGARVLLQTLLSLPGPAGRLSGRVEADFRGEGAEVYARCIVSARLGSLGVAAIALLAAYAAARGKQAQTEEEGYAASH